MMYCTENQQILNVEITCYNFKNKLLIQNLHKSAQGVSGMECLVELIYIFKRGSFYIKYLYGLQDTVFQ